MVGLSERRDDLDVTITQLATVLAENAHYDLSSSTLKKRVSEWESGDRDATDEDIRAISEALDTIRAEQRYQHPRCSNEECGRIPSIEPVDTPEGPICHICAYPSREEGG